MSAEKATNQYEVLSPWADVDPVPLRGIAPRVTDLAGKTIGLFENHKVTAKPILTVVEEKLEERFPTCKFSWYVSSQDTGPASGAPNEQVKTKYKAKFEEWVKGVDAVVAAVGD